MPEVLFDLKQDKQEKQNLIHHPRYRDAVSSLRRRLHELGYGPERSR
jgi:hypothetical protein